MADWTTLDPSPIIEPGHLVSFVDKVGLCLWWTIPNVPLPSLAARMALDRPEDLWDTWFWKDDLHISRQLFTSRLVANRPTFISLRLLPYVIAAQGEPGEGHHGATGSQAANRVYQSLLRYRLLSISHLRRKTRLTEPQAQHEIDAALEALAASFRICKVGITGRSRGTYGYVWGLLEDWLPDQAAQASAMDEVEAARHIVDHLAGVGVTMRAGEWQRLLGWRKEVAAAAAT